MLSSWVQMLWGWKVGQEVWVLLDNSALDLVTCVFCCYGIEGWCLEAA